MQNTRVSIIIPVFNREEIIKTTLDSIIVQTYINWECILVDDGSTDNTKQTINYYIQKDSRFNYIERPKEIKKGANACRNFGFTLAKGEFINWFDSDDVMEPDFLQQKTTAFLPDTNAVLHRNKYSNYKLTRFRESKFKYSSPDNLFYHYALDEIEIQTSGFMWKKEFLIGKQLFNETIRRYQDNEFHIRMLSLRPNIKILNEELAIIRGGDGNPTQISSKQNLTKKKLQDIFYYRYLTLKLNQIHKGNNFKTINKVISKKVLWTYYDALRFEKNIFKRIRDFKNNYGKLKIVYLNEEVSLTDSVKSHFYLFFIIIFGSAFKKKK